MGDFDGDGGWDVAAAGERGVNVALMQRPLTGAGTPTLRSLITVMDQPAARLSTWDYDNDGLTDLVAATPDSVHAFRQTTPGRFAALTESAPAGGGSFALPADIDADDFKSTILGALRRLQKLPHVVRAFFADPDLRYITA